jgi:hypothetical protein
LVVPGRSVGDQVLVKIFVLIPFRRAHCGGPDRLGMGLGWTDLGLAAAFYVLAIVEVTAGYHQHITHRAFKARAACASRWRWSAGWPTTAGRTLPSTLSADGDGRDRWGDAPIDTTTWSRCA